MFTIFTLYNINLLYIKIFLKVVSNWPTLQKVGFFSLNTKGEICPLSNDNFCQVQVSP